MRYLGILICLVLSVLFGFLTKDLKQINQDDLFLGEQSLESYHRFQEDIEEKSLLVITLQKEVNETNYLKIQKIQSDFQKKYPQIEFRSFNDIYFKKIRSKEFNPTREFWKANQGKLQLQLMREEDISLLAAWEPKARQIDFLKEITSNYPELSYSGVPYINFLLDHYAENIKTKIFPLVFITALILTLFITRNFILSILLFLPSLTVFQMTLYMIQLIYGSLNLVTSIVPVLIFVIGISLVFHLYFSFRETMNLKLTFEEKGKPIVMMLLTTMVGFGSLYFGPIVVIKQFAITCVLGLFLSSSFLIGFFALFSHIYPKDIKIWGFGPRYFRRSLSYGQIIAISGFFLLAGFFSLPRIDVLTNAVNFFPKHDSSRKDLLEIGESVLGLPLYEIVFKNENSFTYKDLLIFEKMEKELSAKFPELKLYSLNTFIREANFLYSGQDSLPPLPISYFTLRSQLPSELNLAYPFGESYRITLLGLPLEAIEYEKKMKGIQEILGSNYRVLFNGLYYNLMKTHGHLISVLGKSFVLTILIISALAWILFRSYKYFFIFLFINLMPIACTFIFMFLTGLTINVASVMTFSISLGLVVDSTFHYLFALRGRGKYDNYYLTTLIPIVASSFLLVFSIGVLGFESFIPVKHFGISLSFALFVGMLFDLYVLPTLIQGKTLRQ